MSICEIVAVAFALAMDAFAVSIASGVVVKEQKVRHALRIALFFGGFQAVMPVVGWLAGNRFRHVIGGVDQWVAFGLLSLIGCKMIYEAVKLEPGERKWDIRSLRVLLVLAVATSIDALAVGVTLSLLHVSIITPIIVIGVVTFVVSLLGVLIGERFGHLFESKVEVAGGLVLIAIGVRILVWHSL